MTFNPVLFSLGRARNGSGFSGSTLTQPATSSPYVQVEVIATLDGAAYDPTPDTVQLAFVPMPTSGAAPDPTSGQWNAAAWETDPGSLYWASVLTGPAAGGGLDLAAGAYQVFVQVTDSPSVPVMTGPVLVVT